MVRKWERPLYLMIKPPPHIRRAMIQLCAALGIERRYAPERWHSTLLPLGEAYGATITAVDRALCGFDAAPFAVAFDHIEGDTLKPRKGQRAPGDFQRALAKRLAAFGLDLPAYEFGLHLNLDYAGTSVRRAAIPLLSWPVEEILLIESWGGRHRDRGNWRLQSRQLELGF